MQSLIPKQVQSISFTLLGIFLCIFINAQTIGLISYDEELSHEGYTLFAPSASFTTYLIDNCGFVANTWVSDFTPGLSVYLLEDGKLLRTGRVPGAFNGGGVGGVIEMYSWEGDLYRNFTKRKYFSACMGA